MIKNRLKEYRHKHMMNQKQFAAFLGVNHRQYNQWELQRAQPDWENAFKICAKLEISLNELMFRAP
jgi:putative transcriptional regulator